MISGLNVPSTGRGGDGHDTEMQLDRVRSNAAELFGFGHPQRVIFTPGLTYAINQVLHGCIKTGDTVLTSRLEHNAVVRPLETLRQQGVNILEADFDQTGMLRLDQFERLLKENPVDWVVLTMASNVLGTIQPLAAASQLAQQHGAKVICDLAQTAGLVPIELDAWGISAAAVPGHKGLHGPRGIGLLLLAPGIEPQPLVQGGTGSSGHDREMPPDLPIRLEAGTQNYPGMLGLGAALRYLRKNPPLLGNGRKLMSELDAWLRALPATEVYPKQCPGWEHRLPLVSFNFEGVPNDIVCSYLQSRGLNLRGGLLCAGPSCADIGADQGVVRLSPPLDASADEYLQVRQILTEASDVLR